MLTKKSETPKNLNFVDKPFFIKNIPQSYDYVTIFSFFKKFGSLYYFQPVFSTDMSFIRFIFLVYKEERSNFYLQEHFKTKGFIINFINTLPTDNNNLEKRDLKYKCNELRSEIINYLKKNNIENMPPSLFFTDKEKWNKKVENIKEIIKKY